MVSESISLDLYFQDLDPDIYALLVLFGPQTQVLALTKVSDVYTPSAWLVPHLLRREGSLHTVRFKSIDGHQSELFSVYLKIGSLAEE